MEIKTEGKTPISIITGYLGVGKTTLLLKILADTNKKIAILMNEFGQIAIDAAVIKGKAIDIAELEGGCVCCSLQGEFEEAIREILQRVEPDAIVVETTGVAEPDAIVIDVQENLPEVKLDSVICIVDCDAMARFPAIGYTGRIQIEIADVLLLNKIDLVDGGQLENVEEKVKQINPEATIFKTNRCNIDTRVLFGLEIEKVVKRKEHVKEGTDGHFEGIESFSYSRPTKLSRKKFEDFLQGLPHEVYRAKGFVVFEDGSYLFSYVAGRYDFEPFKADRNEMVFIGKNVRKYMKKIINKLRECEA